MPRRTAAPIERQPRGTPEYEAKLAALAKSSPSRALDVELAEEMVRTGEAHLRRELPDGTVFDLSAYQETGVLLSFRANGPHGLEFIDFIVYG